jgi:hypothetical protein
MPIVDWSAMDAPAPATDDREALDAFWSSVAYGWLDALRVKLGSRYAVRESEHFLLLSPLEELRARATLEYVETTRRRILALLEGIAEETELGKLCVLIFADPDRYYEYVANYYPPEGLFAQSGGLFLQEGYGHFVFVADDMSTMEPTIVHELTHCLVQHLPLPAWLNEGIAVNTEERLAPRTGRRLHTAEEMQRKHAGFWSETTLQDFWSGRSWYRPGDANMLSYDLARQLVVLAASEGDAFRDFANAADAEDSGAAAALAHLGYPVATLAEAVLGEGAWQPRPEAWTEGIERGWFRPGRFPSWGWSGGGPAGSIEGRA